MTSFDLKTMKFTVCKQYFTVRAKIEPTTLGSISYEGEKSRADPGSALMDNSKSTQGKKLTLGSTLE